MDQRLLDGLPDALISVQEILSNILEICSEDLCEMREFVALRCLFFVGFENGLDSDGSL
jgi:hypothetical protein